MNRLGEKLTRIGGVIENEKVTKFENFDRKIADLFTSIEETREINNKKFNDIKEQILVIQKTIDDEGLRRDSTHAEFMDFLKKMEEKVFEKFDYELRSKKEAESRVAKYLEEKFSLIKAELQKESK